MEFSRRCNQWQKVASSKGCVFENLRFVEDEAGSVSVFAVEVGKPIELRITSLFIVEENGIALTNQGQMVIPSYCEDKAVRAVLDEMLAYIMSQSRVDGHRALFISFSKLPGVLRKRLLDFGLVTDFFMRLVSEFVSGEDWLESDVLSLPLEPDDQALRHRLLMNRMIDWGSNRKMWMPFVDFVNHDPLGLSFMRSEGAISLSGVPARSKEVTAFYNASDAWGLLNNYGFSGQSNYAYSVSLRLVLSDGVHLQLGRPTADLSVDEEGVPLPKVYQDGRSISLSHVWIGCVGNTQRPFESFTSLWQKLGREDALSAFGHVVRLNWLAMRELRQLVGDLDSCAAHLVRSTLNNHMHVMSEQNTG